VNAGCTIHKLWMTLWLCTEHPELSCKSEVSSVDWITVLVCIANVDRLTTVTSDTCQLHMTNCENLKANNSENVTDIFS